MLRCGTRKINKLLSSLAKCQQPIVDFFKNKKIKHHIKKTIALRRVQLLSLLLIAYTAQQECELVS
jgi:cytidine deaminase